MENDITDIGKVAITPQKDYKSEQTYEWLDVVTYDGASYMCIHEDGCTGIVPTNTGYWQLLADKGHFTEEDKEEFKKAVVEESKTEINEHTDNKKTELNNYTTELEKSLENELNTYKIEKEVQLDLYKATLETEMANKKDSLIEEIETAQDGFDANVEEKTNTFNSNVETKTTEFNNNSNTKTEEFNNNSTEKINNFNSNAEEKIANYNEHVETLTSRIADLEEETEDLFNALPTEKVNGTELYIEDAKPCRVINTEIGGMHKQETTQGINIDNTKLLTTATRNGITRTVMDDGGIKLKGIATAQWNIPIFPTELAHLEEGAYTFVCYGLPTDLSINIYYVGNVSGETVRKFTANGTSDYYINLTVTEGTTINCTLYPFLIKGSYTADNIPKYEPYTGGVASPNPDYPQVIEQVNSVKLQYTGSNLFNYTKISTSSSSTSGLVITLGENGDITVSGKPKYSYPSIVLMQDITNILKDGETYYMNQSNHNTFCYLEVAITKNDDSITYLGTQVSEKSFVVDKTNFKRYTIKAICCKLEAWGEEEKTITSNFKLTRQKSVPFEKYQNQAINIDLKGNKLCAISDTIKDKLLIDRDGNVALQKNVNYSTFNEFNTVNGSFVNSTQFILNISNCVKSVDQNSFYAISNCMLKNITNGGIGFFGTTSSGNIRVTVLNNILGVTQEDTTSTKLSAAKTFLQNLQQTPEIYYPVEVPELIDLGQIPELPKTFEGINNIWAETNLGNTEIEIEYVQDVKKLLEKQAEQQNARLDNIETLLSTTQTSALLLDNMQEDLEKEVE